jgi:O-antigen ligase
MCTALATPLIAFGEDPDSWKWPWMAACATLLWIPIFWPSLRERRFNWRKDGLTGVGIVWFGCIGVAALLSTGPLSHSFQPVSLVALGLLLYVSVINSPAQNRSIKAWVFPGIAIVVILEAVIAIAGGSTHPLTPGVLGTFGNPNFAGEFCSWALPVCTGLFFMTDSTTQRILFGASLVAGSALAVLTLSMGAWIAAGSSVALILILGGLVFHRRTIRDPKWLVIAVTLLALGALAGREGQDTSATTGPPPFSTLEVRKKIWKASMTTIKDHPILGAGPGRFDESHHAVRDLDEARLHNASFYTDRPATGMRVVESAHNNYIHILVENGIAGLLAFLLFATAGLWKMITSILGRPRTLENWGILAWAGGAIGLLIHGLVSDPLIRPAQMTLFMLSLAFLERMGNPKGRLTIRPVHEPRLAAMACLIVGGSLLTVLHIQDALATDGYHRIQQSQASLREQIDEMTGVVALAPERADVRAWMAQSLYRRAANLPPNVRDRDQLLREAEGHARAAVRLDPHHPVYNMQLGLILQGQPESIAFMQHAVEVFPIHPHYQYNLGLAHLLAHNFSEAQSGFARALKLSTNHLPSLAGIASALYMRGQTALAVTYLAGLRDLHQDVPAWITSEPWNRWLGTIVDTPEYKAAFRRD